MPRIVLCFVLFFVFFFAREFIIIFIIHLAMSQRWGVCRDGGGGDGGDVTVMCYGNGGVHH